MRACIALIPARGGSARVPGKNIRTLAGHPMIAYTICAARDSGLFDALIVSTDDARIAAIARAYGAETPFLRPAELAGPTSPDIDWVLHALDALAQSGRRPEAFALLRPTSPFRTAETIRRAAATFEAQPEAHSLRAVEPCRQHPGKMWVRDGERLRPLLEGGPVDPPWHSTPYQALPPVLVQNASLEIARVAVVRATRTIAGTEIVPFLTRGHEGFDINDPLDWIVAEHLARTGEARLPEVAAVAAGTRREHDGG